LFSPILQYSILFIGGFMSRPANKKLIGGFVLGATVLLVVAVVIFGSGKIFSKTIPVVFYFEGSVKGLDIGAPLVIRGVKVGAVTDVQLVYNPKDQSVRIPVHGEIDPEKIMRVGGVIFKGKEQAENLRSLIDHGLRAQLQIQSIVTGQLMVNLDFLPRTPANLVGKDQKENEIPTVPTVMQEISQKLQEVDINKLIDRFVSVLEGMDRVINSPELRAATKDMGPTLNEAKRLLASVNEEFKPMVKDTRSLIQNVDKVVVKVDRRFDPLVAKIEGTLDEVGPMASDLKKILAKVDGTLEETRKLVENVNGQVGPVAADLKKALADAQSALAQAQKTLAAAETNFTEGSEFYHAVNEALQGANEASRAAQLLIEYLQRHPDSVIWGKTAGGKR
jgi:paraquat-inducible protein B